VVSRMASAEVCVEDLSIQGNFHAGYEKIVEK